MCKVVCTGVKVVCTSVHVRNKARKAPFSVETMTLPWHVRDVRSVQTLLFLARASMKQSSKSPVFGRKNRCPSGLNIKG